jgi:uncharacterized protein (TIGR01777 family)
MKVAITGATGLIGTRLVAALQARGDEVTVLARDPARAQSELSVRATEWDATAGAAPAQALSGVVGVLHLAGAPVAQRWSAGAKERIQASRLLGTANLVAGIRAADPRPTALVSASASGYYGDRGAELLPESASPGPDDDFLASVCVGWERAAAEATELGVRVVTIRNGVVLDRAGGALPRMLPPFKAFVGGPIAGGGQYMSWVSLEDVAGLYLAALDGSESWSGPVNCCAPGPVTNAEFSRALGKALRRPAVLPVPGLALRGLYGEMASIILASQRMVPARAAELGYEFRHTDLDEALRGALR